MLWNKDLLFVHYPKTAGISLTRAFVGALARPITCYVTPGQIAMLRDLPADGLTICEGRGHENLSTTRKILAERDLQLRDCRAIVVCIRNPYDWMVSNYEYLRARYDQNTQRENFRIAHEQDFESFTEAVGVAPIERWMSLDGEEPPNLRVLRFESLQRDFDRLADEIGFTRCELPRLNQTPHAHFSTYVTPRVDRAIASKFSYLFDKGYYPRSTVTTGAR